MALPFIMPKVEPGPYLWWTLTVHDEGRVFSGGQAPCQTRGRVILAVVTQGNAGVWPRATALRGPGLETVAVLWAPQIVAFGPGAVVELKGMANYDTGRMARWVLTQPGGTDAGV